MGKTRRAYPPEFRRQIVELVHAGRSPKGVGKGVRGCMRRGPRRWRPDDVHGPWWSANGARLARRDPFAFIPAMPQGLCHIRNRRRGRTSNGYSKSGVRATARH
jgi:hypothetical protein